MGTVPAQYIDALVQSGAMTSSLATQEAAAEQVNNATTGSSGTDTATTNPAWGKAIPTLIGHTKTVCLPLWTGNPTATFDSAGNETDTIDFASYIGFPGPSETTATLLRIWFDDVPVYDSSDASVGTLTGAALTFTFYDGTQTAPDPTILASNGGVATPAFTGKMYIVFTALVTRTVDADTSVATTQFRSLPTVQVEILQAEANTATGATIRPFYRAIPAADGAVLANYYSYKKGLYYVLTHTVMSIYVAATMQLLGRVVLQGFNAGAVGITNPRVLTQAGYFICVGPNNNWVAYDLTTGLIIANNKGKDPNGVGLPDEFGTLTDLGNGFILSSGNFSQLVRFDGSNFYACSMVGWRSLYDGTIINDNAANIADQANFDAVGMSYVCGNGSNYIRRIIMTQDGDATIVSQVALITADGSNKPVMKASQVDQVLTLTNGETVNAVLVDELDNTKVYALISSPADGPQLRTYATFFYYNPQDGGTPPESGYQIYQNFDTLTELSRVNIPNPQFNDLSTYQGVQYRDRRYPSVGYYQVRGFTTLNFKTGATRTYLSGNYYDQNGNVIGSFNNWNASMIKLGPNDEFLCDGMEYIGNTPNVITWPAKLIPQSETQEEAPYTLAALFSDICYLAGYERADVTCINMDDTVTGMQLNQSVLFTDLLAQLDAAFRIDLVEQPDGTLIFNRRILDRTADFPITPDKLLLAGSDDSGNRVAIDRVATNEIPSVLELDFINEDYNFVVGAATVRRTTYPVPTVWGESSLVLSVPLVMTAEQAVYYAGLALFDMWASKQNYQINLPPSLFVIEPGDFVSFTRPSGRTDLCKVIEIQLAADRTIAVSLSGVGPLKPQPYYQNALKPTQIAPTPTLSYGTFNTPAPNGTYFTVVDNVGLLATDVANTDIPLYLAVSKPADVYTQYGSAAPVKVATLPESEMGLVTVPLPATAFPHQTVSSTVALTLLDNTLPLPTAPGQVLLGAPGRWELVGFTGIALAADGVTVTLSGLTRGLSGTETATSGHVAGELAIFAPTGLARASVALANLGKTVKLYAMAPGKPASAALGVVDTLSITGAALAPRMPLAPKGIRQPNGDVLFSWYRQDRAEPDTFYDDPPMSEAKEQYTLTLPTLVNGVASSKQLVVNTNSYTYAAGDQATDGNTLVTQYSLSIAQISAIVGNGTPWKGVVNVQ